MREIKFLIKNVNNIVSKVNHIRFDVNQKFEKKNEIEILFTKLSEIKTKLKVYFSSLVTGLKVNLPLEEELDNCLKLYVSQAKTYVLQLNKELKDIGLRLNKILLRVNILCSQARELEIENSDEIICNLRDLMFNSDDILFKLNALNTLVSELKSLILLSLKEVDQGIAEEINVQLAEAKLQLAEIRSEFHMYFSLEIKQKDLKIGKGKVKSFFFNAHNVDDIAIAWYDEMKRRKEIGEAKELHELTEFTTQVNSLILPLKEINDDSVDFVSNIQDIFFKLQNIEIEINTNLQIDLNNILHELNKDLAEVQKQLNLYMVLKVKEQLKCVKVDMNYKYKDIIIYLRKSANMEKIELADLKERVSKIEEFDFLKYLFSWFATDVNYYLVRCLDEIVVSNFFKVILQLKKKLNEYTNVKLHEITKYLKREKNKEKRRKVYQKINEEIMLFLNLTIDVKQCEDKEIKVYLVSPFDEVNEVNVDIDYMLKEVNVYLVSPLKKIKDELQAYTFFLLKEEIKVLGSKIKFLKEIKDEVNEDDDPFFSMLELKKENQNLREETKKEIVALMESIKKEIKDFFFYQDKDKDNDNDNENDIIILSNKVREYKKTRARLRIIVKKEFSDLFYKIKTEKAIKNILSKVKEICTQLEELEIILLYAETLKFFSSKESIQVCLVKKNIIEE